ncbi:GTP-binding protein 8-like isoform X2 [Mercenaria mercenaria]|uniref:GTP-binding protein 8-like isoform X2 n=1 Tax=Mercenaria mercenaria TaxID=6596 RepID=UPI00234EF586|nr:GTP-binding protein 8-like isoform X2 [Mercenaria mercenaria]
MKLGTHQIVNLLNCLTRFRFSGPSMNLLQKSCLDLRLKSVFQAIGYLTVNARRVSELCQRRSLCQKCYSSLCRRRTPVSELYSQDLNIHRRNLHEHSSKLFTDSSLLSYKDHSVIINRRVHCQHTGVKELNKVQNRWLNNYTYHGQCRKYCSADLLSCGNSSVWQHMESRGMKSGRDKVGQTVDEILNPIDRLQQFVAVPLLPEKDYMFRPSEEEVAEAQQLFISGPKHDIKFLKSAVFEEHLPDYELPEVAFIGRSNVGKSSLIQMLLSHTDALVRVSKKPGSTKLLNFFQVGKRFTLVDMPGYGYNMPEHYASSVENFLSTRKNLKMTFLLIDGYGPNTVDAERFEMINSMNIDYCIVMTKIDKAKPGTLLKSFMTVLKYRNKTHHCFPQPFLVSSVNGEGVPLLQAFITYVTGCVSFQGL